jgi:predicted nuclease of predicted toxin-antitoxin system
VKFLVDAQLPRRVVTFLNAAGHEAIHTLDLPDANQTTDSDIIKRADAEGAVVVTKDSDFVNSFLLKRQPAKLLLVATGNITNRDLDALLTAYLNVIVTKLTTHDFVELTTTALILRA